VVVRGKAVPDRDKFYGWKLVGVLFALDFLNMGFPYFGGAVINAYMLKQIPMDRSTYGLAFTLFNLFIGLPSMAIAACIMKWGARTTFAIGSAITFSGALWLAFFATEPWHYLVAYGCIIATGTSFSTIVPITTVVSRWFKRYRGRAMGIPLGASGVAGFVSAPLINKILAANGGNWREAWLVVAGIVTLSAIIALAFVKERPEDLGQSVDGDPAPNSTIATSSAPPREYSWTPADAYRTRSYWLVVVGGVASQFPYFFFVAHWLLYLRGSSIHHSIAAWAMGLFTISTIVGRITGGALMDKIVPRYAFISGLCLYFAGSVLAMRINSGSLPVIFSAGILYGIAFGWSFICMNAITARYYGPASFPKLNGMMMLLTGIVSAPAGVIGGRIFDRFGGYTHAFELNILLAAVGILALSFATPPQRRESASGRAIDAAGGAVGIPNDAPASARDPA
jgi:MFS family permease